jgi:large subunit ribosomal protein L9
MAIEVLLMADVADVGAEGDVVSVADGFARNYLFPSKRAAPVTQATRKRLEKRRHPARSRSRWARTRRCTGR